MNYPIIPYRIFPLGDSAITVDFGNTIDETVNREILNRFYYLQHHPLDGMIEAIPAYSSLTVYYDLFAVKKIAAPDSTAFNQVKQQLEDFLRKSIPDNQVEESLIKIPVCYEDGFAPDIRQLARVKNISVDEVIQIHTSGTYRVYMLGFLPGFAYMGEVDDKIATARKPQPANVVAGSVGIAGKQTGIYPMASPGGWQIIGRTPVKLFDKENEDPVLLKAGDRIMFYSISRHEFENY
jgi:inhibitor of KinA